MTTAITPIRAELHPGLTFDEDQHRYYCEGRWIRSVTQVLNLITGPIYARIPDHVLDYAKTRGSNVHGWTELLDLGEAETFGPTIRALDGTILQPDHAEWQYVLAWLRFRDETGFIPEVIEQRFYHPRHRYSGTVDRIGLLNDRRATLEIKTVAQLAPWVGLQTAGYHEAFNHERPRADQARERFAVQLRRDGSYRLEHYQDAGDFSAFLAMKQVWDWSDAHGAAPVLDIDEQTAAVTQAEAQRPMACGLGHVHPLAIWDCPDPAHERRSA